MTGSNGWNKWEKYVVSELSDLKEGSKGLRVVYEGLRDELQLARMEIERLKVKAGIWGLIGGAVPVVIGLGIWALRG